MVSRAPTLRPRTTGRKPFNKGPKPEPVVLFQKYFKSVGPRTYAAQVKQAANGNHMLVLTEGRRDEATGELRKSRMFVYSEDFVEMFKLLHETALFIRQNPVDPKVKAKRDKYWASGGGAKAAPDRAQPRQMSARSDSAALWGAAGPAGRSRA